MRLILIICLFFIASNVFSQEIYSVDGENVLSLNAVKKDGDKVVLKVLGKNGIAYIKEQDKQTDQLSFRQYIDTLLAANLELICSGDEPFWHLTIRKGDFTYNTGDEEVKTNLQFYYPNSDDYWLRAIVMFKSEDNSVFGTIERNTNVYTIDEEEITFLHCRVCIGGEVFTGTVKIEENNEI